MIKSLFDFNSPANIWLRENKLKASSIGCAIAAVFLIPTAIKIVKESRSA